MFKLTVQHLEKHSSAAQRLSYRDGHRGTSLEEMADQRVGSHRRWRAAVIPFMPVWMECVFASLKVHNLKVSMQGTYCNSSDGCSPLQRAPQGHSFPRLLLAQHWGPTW